MSLSESYINTFKEKFMGTKINNDRFIVSIDEEDTFAEDDLNAVAWTFSVYEPVKYEVYTNVHDFISKMYEKGYTTKNSIKQYLKVNGDKKIAKSDAILILSILDEKDSETLIREEFSDVFLTEEYITFALEESKSKGDVQKVEEG